MGKRMGVTSSWTMEANSGVRGHVRARQKSLEGDDRQTDRQTHRRSVHYMMMVSVQTGRSRVRHLFQVVVSGQGVSVLGRKSKPLQSQNMILVHIR